MLRGKFIGNILRRYQAFFDERPSMSMKHNYASSTFVWACDTPFAKKPIFDAEDLLYDYSCVLDTTITRENYKDFIKDPCHGVIARPIANINSEKAEEVMKNNMYALLRYDQLMDKAKTLKSIMEE